jgi:hypothetical protein
MRAGEGGRARGLGCLAELGQKQSAGLVSREIPFLFPNLISRNSRLNQIQILKKKKAFSKVDPKTKVIQNLILYNFA